MADGGPGPGGMRASGRLPAQRPSLAGAIRHARRLPGRIAADMAHDLAARRGFLWIPVAFGTGAAVYFQLPVEPPALLPPVLTALAVVAVVIARRRAPTAAVAATALAALVALGLAAAKLAVDRAAAPVLAYSRAVTVTGWIEQVEDREERGLRLRLRVMAIDPPPREGLPVRARITVRSGAVDPLPGETWTMLARLGPPQPPLYPGGYDFARAAWFDGIGAVGFALGMPERREATLPDGLDGWRTAIERLRGTVSDRIRAEIRGDAGAIAAALIVGDRGAISREADEAMRISGLSHVLSISGLHMALVAGLVFGGLRALLALIPALALNAPIKSIAAAAALAATVAYLLVAGLNLPTQRSAVMIAVALTATMIGRRAVTLRTVAVAALVVLVLQPAAVLDPGAQMSFAAVIALASAFEALAARRAAAVVADRGDVSPVVRIAGKAALWVGLTMLTSLVAGLATAPMALHHFNRLAPLGLVANLAASPVIAFAIMPAGLIAALLMPLGLDGLPLAVMGWGIDAMVAIAEAVAAATPAGGTFGRPATAATLLIAVGGLWTCLWTRSARLPGLPLLLAGLALVTLPTAPDLIVAGDGGRALVRLPDGELVVLGRADAFETGLWLAALGDPRRPADPALVRRVRCDREACSFPGIAGPSDTDTNGLPGAGAADPPRTGPPGAGAQAHADPPHTVPPRVNPTRAEAAGRNPDDTAEPPGSAVADTDSAEAGSRLPTGRSSAALVRQPWAFADECPAVDLVITALDAPDWCRALTTVIDARDLDGTGTRTFRLDRDPATGRWIPVAIARSIPAIRRPWQNGRP